VIKAENIKISEQTQFLLSLTPNEIITENIFLFHLTETWFKPNDYFSLIEASPPGWRIIFHDLTI